jgi:hypothetical protein
MIGKEWRSVDYSNPLGFIVSPQMLRLKNEILLVKLNLAELEQGFQEKIRNIVMTYHKKFTGYRRFFNEKKGTIGSIQLKDPNFRYILWTPHVIDSCGPTCK